MCKFGVHSRMVFALVGLNDITKGLNINKVERKSKT